MTMTKNRIGKSGFTLIELVIVIIVLGVVAAVVTKKLQPSIETARYEQTKGEMEQLAYAIVGNPALYARGARTDFGYVGDIGALPPNLDALLTNPGGYSTWNGPYMGSGFSAADFKTDGWGIIYTYIDTLIRSTGSGSNIDKILANSSAELLSNSVMGNISDAGMNLPGVTYRDSIRVELIYPDGSGGTAISTINPTSNGYFSFTGIPLGNHNLRVIYLPDSDTTTLATTVYPGESVKLNILLPAELW